MKPRKITLSAVGLSLVVTSVLFLFLSSQFLIKISNRKDALEPVLVITVSSPKQDLYTLYYDPDGKDVNWVAIDVVPKPPSQQANEQVLRFTLPGGEIARLRLDVGKQPDTVLIRRIAIVTRNGNTCAWKGSELTRLFPQSSTDIRSITTASNAVKIETNGIAPSIISDPFEMEKECDQGNVLSTRQRLQWWSAGALVFGLLAVMFRRFLQQGASLSELTLISGLLMLIALPLITQVLGLANTAVSAENRALNIDPGTPESFDDLRRFPSRWTVFYNDHFGGRNEMIFWSNQLKVRLLNTSPVPTVVLGKDRWLYYAGDQSISDYQGLLQMPESDLERMNKQLEDIRDGLEKRGIKFLVVIAPDKQTIYPEYLPSSVQNAGRPTRVDQFLEYNARHAQVEVLDLRPVLIEKKSNAPMDIYYKTDTHWNWLGGFYAYQAMIRRISAWFPHIAPRELSDYEIRAKPIPGNDLAKITMMRSYFMDTEVTITSIEPDTTKTSILEYPVTLPRQPFAVEQEDRALPKMVMFHDSFAQFLIPFLSQHFERSVYLWTFNFDWELIDKEEPDLVILQVVERQLGHIAPVP